MKAHLQLVLVEDLDQVLRDELVEALRGNQMLRQRKATGRGTMISIGPVRTPRSDPDAGRRAQDTRHTHTCSHTLQSHVAFTLRSQILYIKKK